MWGIVCISGTSRPENFTSRALQVVVDELRNYDVEPIVFDARDLSLGFPGESETEDMKKLQKAIATAPAIILATPEYHGSFSAMTKLIIENLGFPSVLEGKPVALLGVAAGRIGAIKSIEHLKGVCSHIGAIVVPGAISIAGVQNAFTDDGHCTDADTEAALRSLPKSLLDFLDEYVAPRHALETIVRSDGPAWSTNV
jgi:NAD(P)H-dependent FMN reductase